MNLNDYQKALAEPFLESEIGWKPEITKKTVNGKKVDIMRGNQQVAGCTAHIDARNVMERLDSVVGIGNWSDSYRIVSERNVECTLTVCGVSKSDVGQTNEGGFADPMKSAYSDALKRAAVKFGIGRHLYGMEMRWLPFDGYRILTTNEPVQAPKPAQAPKPEPSSNGNGHSEKLMSDVKFRDYIERELGFKNGPHVISTMKLLGFWPTPSTSDERKRCFEALKEYRTLRDENGLNQDDALLVMSEQGHNDKVEEG